MTKLSLKRVIKANPLQTSHQKWNKNVIWQGDVFEVTLNGQRMGLAKTVDHDGSLGWVYEVCINGKVIRARRKHLAYWIEKAAA